MRVYRIDGQGSSWERLGQAINGDNAYDNVGWSMNLSTGGNTIAIGSPKIDGYDGYGGGQEYVRVFSLEVGDDNVGTGSWKQIGRDILGEVNVWRKTAATCLERAGFGSKFIDQMNRWRAQEQSKGRFVQRRINAHYAEAMLLAPTTWLGSYFL